MRRTGRGLDRNGSRSGSSLRFAGQVWSLLGCISCHTGEVGLLVNGGNARLPMQRQMLGGYSQRAKATGILTECIRLDRLDPSLEL